MRSTMRFFACVFFSLLVFASAAAPPRMVRQRPTVLRLTLDRAIRLALEKNFSIEVTRYDPLIAREGVTEAWGRFDPVFDVTLGRNEQTRRDVFTGGMHTPTSEVTRTDEWSTGISGITPLGTTYDFGLGNRNNTGTFNAFDEDMTSTASMSLRQPLLRGFGPDANLAQVRIARNNVLVSEWQLRQRVIDVIGNTALLACRRFQSRIRRDARDEVLAQVRRKLSKALVTEDLSGAQDRGGVDVVTLGEFARRKETRLVDRVENCSQQSLTARVQTQSGAGKTILDGTRSVVVPLDLRSRGRSFFLPPV